MKKELLLSVLVIICSSYSFAQITIEENRNPDRKIIENYSPNNNNNKAGGGWFNYGREIESLSSDFTTYNGVLHPDSTMIDAYIDSNGDTTYYNVWHHSEGQILDPTSLNFFNTGNSEFFGAGEGFILDSIYFPYQYLRPQTQNPDKLIVQFYTTDNGGIVQGSLVGGATFYHCDYSASNNRGLNAAQTIEYDLTAADECHPDSLKIQVFALNPPLQLNNGGLVAATYTFVPGNPYNTGDTLATAELSNVVNPRNSFLISYFSDAEPLSDPGYENYNLSIPSDVQYDASTNGWNGSYVPGNAWSNSSGEIDRHQNIWFHLTPYTAPNNITDMGLASINLYPNPAKDIINVELTNLKNVETLKIIDLTGRTIDTKTLEANLTSIEINTSKYKPGIYFLEVNGPTTIQKLKFTKIK